MSAAPSARASRDQVAPARRKLWPALPVNLFLIGLIIPWAIEIGSFGLTVSRVVLLVMTVPCLIKWSRGDAGRQTPLDWIALMLCAWVCVALIVNAGLADGIESGGMIAVETAGAYFLARCYVRTAADFKSVVRLLFCTTVLLLPFALIEALTGNNIAMSIFGAVLPTVKVSYDGLRMGLKRVQSVYEHPILFGVCSGLTLSLVYIVLGQGRSLFFRLSTAALVFFTAALSMSSGPYGAMAAQIGLMGWAAVTARIKYNWLLFGGLVLATFVIIEVGSNQSVPQFYISRFSFDRDTAWLRLLIWEFGSASVLNHPLFGIGFGSWARPVWLSDSIDMFWMAAAVRYGIPGGLLTLALPTAALIQVSSARLTDPIVQRYRLGYLIVIGSFFVVGWTVHFWGAAYLLLLFMLGAGGWFRSPAAMDAKPLALAGPALRPRGGFAVAHLARASI
jgi:hypothetical protein